MVSNRLAYSKLKERQADDSIIVYMRKTMQLMITWPDKPFN